MQVCHGAVFLYQGDTGYLYAVIVMGIVLGVYMLFRMCKLCFSAFSYSNFHIHETYKFYAIAIIALAFTIMFHKTQLEYINAIQDDSITAIDNVTQEGYKILIEIFGIISIFFSRVLYTLNGFIWLLVTLGCDYTPESELTMSRLAFSLNESKIKQNIRKRIQLFKVITVYFAYPLFILLSLIGTLEQEETWCSISKAALIITSVSTVAILAIGSGLFLYRRKNDQSVPKTTKITLLCLLVAIAFRQLYLIATQVTSTAIFNEQYILLTYTFICVLAPIIAISILSERQLEREKCAILKSSEVMLFKSLVN